MRKLTVAPLSHDQIAQAFPLVRQSEPDLPLERWQDFAETLLEDRGQRPKGIMAVMSEQDYILGLFTYRIESDLRHERILSAENFCAMDIIDPKAVASALAEGLEDLAERHGCGAIHTTISPSMSYQDHWLARMFEGIGHEAESVRFCKTLRPS
ncbi:MAG: hypothetical protein R3316_11650 [Rhodovibrionaceae bacterium]|nr:hypothetical protein [Rhodovibrionaceae bacterium]